VTAPNYGCRTNVASPVSIAYSNQSVAQRVLAAMEIGQLIKAYFAFVFALTTVWILLLGWLIMLGLGALIGVPSLY
jgi:hypothetical protein